MTAYIIKRILFAILTVCVTSVVIFFLVRQLPGDIIYAVMGESAFVGFEAEAYDRAAFERELGLDVPEHIQFLRWVGVAPYADGNFSGILQGDLGISWWKRQPVGKLLTTAWPVTLQLSLMGLIIAQLIALPVGIYSALRQDTWGDYIGRTFAILAISIPGFWLGTIVIVYPSIWWGYMPPIMFTRFIEDPLRNLRMFIVPAIVLGMGMSGMTMRITRTMMLEVLRQDYVRTAWAKGLRERVVIMRHALKNALIPVITLIGLQVPILIGGTVIIEQIFVLPGMGRLVLSAILQRDHGLTCGVFFLFSIAIVLTNLAVDLTYSYLDPRVHYK